MPDLPQGTQIKGYTLDVPIGRGRYSVVYRATEDATGMKYAVKVVHKQKAGLVAFKGTRKEALLLQNLDHPHVIRVYDFEEEYGVLYVIMELLEGGDLFDKVTELHSYTEDFARKLARNLVTVLDYLHRNGVCHRDIKPENLMLRHQKTDEVDAEKLFTEIVLVDFGTATKFYGFEERCAASMTDFMGTPEYMAPEVIRTGVQKAVGYNEKCDIWSAGVVLYILLCGWPPFFADSPPLLFDSIVRGQYSFPPNTVWDRISLQARDFVAKCLTADPEERASAAQLLDHEWLQEGLPPCPSCHYWEGTDEEEDYADTTNFTGSFNDISLESSVRNLKKNIKSMKSGSKTTGEGLMGSPLINSYQYSDDWEHQRHRKSVAPAQLALTFADEGSSATSPLSPSGEQPQPQPQPQHQPDKMSNRPSDDFH